ncbi:MAG: aminotransferase class V-fold PLP-dependent enzyme [Christensenellales bacterium]
MIYLDNAATTYPKPEEVYEKMDMLTREMSVNAGRGSYELARKATDVINGTRAKIAEFFGAEDVNDVVFTSSATEAANRVLLGYDFKENMTVYVSPYEHNAVMRTLEAVRKKTGIQIKLLATDNKGYLDIEEIEYQFMCDEPDFVCINMASNVTGYILPFEKIAHMAKEYVAVVFADAAQAAGNIKINLKETDIDILIFAGHKSLYGLFGVGGFVTNSRIFERDKKLNPVIFGGNGEDSLNLDLPETGISKYEVGSLNVPAIGALKYGIDSIETDFNEIRQHEDKMFRYMLEKIEKLDGIIVFQKPEKEEEFENHIAVISAAFEKYASDDAGTILDGEYNIAVRTGYHCAPLIHDVIGSKKYGGTIRISIGRYTTKEDIDRLVYAFENMR